LAQGNLEIKVFLNVIRTIFKHI